MDLLVKVFREIKSTTPLLRCFCSASSRAVQSVWPDLAKFHHFGPILKIFCNFIRVFLKKWAIPGLFFFIFVFSIQLTVNVQYKFLLMTGFKPQTSGIGSNRSTNWATTTRQVMSRCTFGHHNNCHQFFDHYIAMKNLVILPKDILSILFTFLMQNLATIK